MRAYTSPLTALVGNGKQATMCPDVEVRRVMDDLMSLPEGPFGAIEATSGKRNLAGPHEAIEQVEVGCPPTIVT